MPPKSFPLCPHTNLIFSPSPDASIYGYKRPTLAQRIAATTPLGTLKPIEKSSTQEEEHASTFPAPLVLPEDELSWDPTYPAQSLRSWIREKDRNKVTPERRTIYLAAPPDVENGLEEVERWAKPRVKSKSKEKSVDFPKTEEVLEFLEAFYHGMPVKMLPRPKLCFTLDIEDEGIECRPSKKIKGKGKSKKTPTKPSETKPSQTLWLNTHTPSSLIGIRSRSTPNNPFTHQLNLNDLLDAAIEILPDDAYALLMIVEHDIYEDEDDDFACGRAYGGSRIAVVSGARYNPILDWEQGAEREHAWPASHCEEFMQGCCEDEEEADGKKKKPGTKGANLNQDGGGMSPMHTALSAHTSLPSLESTPSEAALSGLWLGRVCRTASHELGHCLGIDHCVYYACAMQGTASIIEDARQPPYLCPIDLAKVLRATGVEVVERYKALLEFSENYKEAHLFASYGAWIRGRVEQLEEKSD